MYFHIDRCPSHTRTLIKSHSFAVPFWIFSSSLLFCLLQSFVVYFVCISMYINVNAKLIDINILHALNSATQKHQAVLQYGVCMKFASRYYYIVYYIYHIFIDALIFLYINITTGLLSVNKCFVLTFDEQNKRRSSLISIHIKRNERKIERNRNNQTKRNCFNVNNKHMH